MKLFDSKSFGHKQLIQNVWRLKQNIFIAAFLIRDKVKRLYNYKTPRPIFLQKFLKLNKQVSERRNFTFHILDARKARISSIPRVEDLGLLFTQADCVEFLFMPPSLSSIFIWTFIIHHRRTSNNKLIYLSKQKLKDKKLSEKMVLYRVLKVAVS